MKEKLTPADYLLRNGRIYTQHADQPWVEALAIAGTDIVYAGDSAGAEAFGGKDTVVTDLGGKLVLPGFIDTHDHSMMVMGLETGLMIETPDDYQGDRDVMLQAVRDYLTTNPDGPFFSFGGSQEGAVDITRHDIDRSVSDRPFVMSSATGHGGWANTMALEMCGVVEGQPDPIDSFGRDEHGAPTGYVGTSAAVFYLLSKVMDMPPEAVAANAGPMLQHLSANGITTVFQAGVVQGTEEMYLEVAKSLDDAGELPVRISFAAYFAQRPIHIDSALEALKRLAPIYKSETVWVDTVKIHGDGDFGGRTSALLEPYSDKPDTLGVLSFPDPEQRDAFMLAIVESGAHIHAHAIGDGAVRSILNGFEAVRKAGHTDVRLSTGHTQMVHPDDKPRFAELNVTANIFATNVAVWEDFAIATLGTERYTTRMSPMKSLIDLGARLSFGADSPATPLNPFGHIATSMTRRRVGDTKTLPPARDCLTAAEAIEAYTINGAYQLGIEDIVGSLEVGKRADLIILDRDLFTVAPDEVAETKVLATMMNGKFVYEGAAD